MGASGAIVTLNLVMGGLGCPAAGAGGWTGSALIDGWLNTSASGSSKSVPPKATSTVAPALPPLGIRKFRRGLGNCDPGGGCAGARWGTASASATPQAIPAVPTNDRFPRMLMLLIGANAGQTAFRGRERRAPCKQGGSTL